MKLFQDVTSTERSNGIREVLRLSLYGANVLDKIFSLDSSLLTSSNV